MLKWMNRMYVEANHLHSECKIHDNKKFVLLRTFRIKMC